MQVTIEACGRNSSLFFPPLQRRVRGRFDVRQIAEPEAARLFNRWPEPIPGQRLELNTDTGAAAITEPLHDPAHRQTRLKVEQEWSLPPAREVFSEVDVPTWLYWIKRSVDAGLARVVSGQLPEKVSGKPRVRFFSQEQDDPRDRLIRTLTGLLVANLPADKRRLLDEALAGME
jgi:hypothetical protein